VASGHVNLLEQKKVFINMRKQFSSHRTGLEHRMAAISLSCDTYTPALCHETLFLTITTPRVASGIFSQNACVILACVAGGSGCARETFCGEAANSLLGYAREGIFGSGEAASEKEKRK